ncbi:unnamed protein product [Pleuronectes platessa]|uniref:Hsp90 co-chaperone Cdc37 n=1 Tax=Pleuronectes platessa TaxID=8262 RepID=A0A9N7Z481_PLEPL|nr:unnamed protein product [Pleuronectes platessa]
MSSGAGLDYSVWDHIYVSDDEDVVHPYVDTPSLFRMRHRVSGLCSCDVRAWREWLSFSREGEDLENNLAECKRLSEEAQGRLRELEEGRKEGEEEEEEDEEEREAELKKLQAEARKLRKDEKTFANMLKEHQREEKKLPWNVDSISREGFSRSIVNIQPANEQETEAEKLEKQKSFAEKHVEEIKHFGMLRRWDDSQKYLSDNPHLVCEETANSLVTACIEFEVDEKHALMEQVAHQAIVMQCILDLARTLKVDPRGCFRKFFSNIKTADQTYQDAFHHELELLKERVRSCAQIRMENAVEEEETPVEVYESLPEDIQRSFDEKNMQMLQQAMNKLHPEEGKYHLKRCIDSGLWVPEYRRG